MIAETLTTEYQTLERMSVSLDQTDPHPQNYKLHSTEKVTRIAASLARYGQVKDIVVRIQADGRYCVFAGHSVRQAALHLGWTNINVTLMPQHWSEVDCRGYITADNFNRAEEDIVLYLALIEEQQREGFDLLSVGSSDAELAALVLELAVDMPDDTSSREKMVTNAAAKQQVKAVLYVQQLRVVEQALKRTGLQNRGAALEIICSHYLGKDRVDGESELAALETA